MGRGGPSGEVHSRFVFLCMRKERWSVSVLVLSQRQQETLLLTRLRDSSMPCRGNSWKSRDLWLALSLWNFLPLRVWFQQVVWRSSVMNILGRIWHFRGTNSFVEAVLGECCKRWIRYCRTLTVNMTDAWCEFCNWGWWWICFHTAGTADISICERCPWAMIFWPRKDLSDRPIDSHSSHGCCSSKGSAGSFSSVKEFLSGGFSLGMDNRPCIKSTFQVGEVNGSPTALRTSAMITKRRGAVGDNVPSVFGKCRKEFGCPVDCSQMGCLRSHFSRLCRSWITIGGQRARRRSLQLPVSWRYGHLQTRKHCAPKSVVSVNRAWLPNGESHEHRKVQLRVLPTKCPRSLPWTQARNNWELDCRKQDRGVNEASAAWQRARHSAMAVLSIVRCLQVDVFWRQPCSSASRFVVSHGVATRSTQ